MRVDAKWSHYFDKHQEEGPGLHSTFSSTVCGTVSICILAPQTAHAGGAVQPTAETWTHLESVMQTQSLLISRKLRRCSGVNAQCLRLSERFIHRRFSVCCPPDGLSNGGECPEKAGPRNKCCYFIGCSWYTMFSYYCWGLRCI